MMLKLKQARAMLAVGGWVGPDIEPFCVARAPGVHINPLYGQPAEPMWLSATYFHTLLSSHEGIARFSVLGALEVVGLGFEGFNFLEAVGRPPAGLQTWLRASERVAQHVLDLFTKSIQRSRKEKR